MSPDQLHIRPYAPGDEEPILRGFAQVFGHERSLEDWRWKYGRGEHRILIAEAAGEVLAHFAALPVSLQVDGRPLRAAQVVDVYSRRRPGLARRGVFVRLVECFYELYGGPRDLELIYGFPGERHFDLGVRLLRYSSPRPVAFFRRGLARPPRARRRWWRRAPQVFAGFAEEMAEDLWRRARRRYAVSLQRDGAWLRRRFTERPGVPYHHLWVVRGGRATTWAVVRLGGELVSWADLVWDGGDDGDLDEIARRVEELGYDTGARGARLWLAGDPGVQAVLAARGWIELPEPQRLHLGAVSFTPGLDGADFCRRLYVTMGDADLV